MEKTISNAVAQMRPEFDKGNHDKVIELCSKVLTYKPDHAISLFFRASSRLKKELYEDSESDFLACLPLSENSDQLHFGCLRGLAELYKETEENDKYLNIMSKIMDYKILYFLEFLKK